MRRCVGCMVSKPKNELTRISVVLGKVEVDHLGKADGRGIYICKGNEKCIQKAEKRNALNRGLKVDLTSEERKAIYEEISKEAYGGRVNNESTRISKRIEHSK